MATKTRFPRWIQTDASMNLREVAPGLYVGAVDSAAVQGARWAAVINFCGCGPRVPAPVYRVFAFGDGGDFPPGSLDATLEILRAAQGPVLIHCAAGLSRSVSAAYAMLVAHYGLDRARAMALVKAHPRFPVESTLRSAELWLRRRGN
jgi:hypothetical protein